jgi:hypothetical protein
MCLNGKIPLFSFYEIITLMAVPLRESPLPTSFDFHIFNATTIFLKINIYTFKTMLANIICGLQLMTINFKVF